MSGTIPLRRTSSNGLRRSYLPVQQRSRAFDRVRLPDVEGFVECHREYGRSILLSAPLDPLRIDIDRETTPPFNIAASSSAPPMPPMPPDTTSFPGQISAKLPVGRAANVSKVPCNDALRADVDPTAGSHLSVHHQSATFQSRRTVPGVGPCADVMFELAIRTREQVREYETRRPVYPTGPVTSRRFRRPDSRTNRVERPVAGGLPAPP